MHIVHLYKDYAPVFGGIEAHLQTLAEGLASHGYQITVVVCQPRGMLLPAYENRNGVSIIRLPRHIDIASNAWSWYLARTVRALAPDALHLQMPWPSGDLVAWFLRDIPLVVSYQSDVVRQQTFLRFYRPLLRWTLAHAQVICASSAAYAHSSPWLQPVLDKVVVVPLGIPDPFAVPPTPVTLPPLPDTYALWVGRMRYYKGLDTAIRALAFLPVHIALVLVGSGPEESRLRSLADELGVAARIHWLGSLDAPTVLALRKRARCFVFPSHLRAEAYGLALLEALACGLPAVSCAIGTATSELNRDGVTGFVVPPNAPEAFAAAIARLCNDEVVHDSCSQAARARFLEHYTEKTMVARMATIYDTYIVKNKA